MSKRKSRMKKSVRMAIELTTRLCDLSDLVSELNDLVPQSYTPLPEDVMYDISMLDNSIEQLSTISAYILQRLQSMIGQQGVVSLLDKISGSTESDDDNTDDNTSKTTKENIEA